MACYNFLIPYIVYLGQIYIYGLNFTKIGCIWIFYGGYRPPCPPHMDTYRISTNFIVFLVQIYMYNPNFTKFRCICILKGGLLLLLVSLHGHLDSPKTYLLISRGWYTYHEILDWISAGIFNLSRYSKAKFLRGNPAPHSPLTWPPREFSQLPFFS